MSVRRLYAGTAAAAVVAASLSIAGPALADPPAGYVPASSDIIGVGSDTSEHALSYLADGKDAIPGYNATNPANKLVSWNATAPVGAAATINIPGNATAARPNGSGNGKKTLYGAGNVAEIDFARSSSALNADEKSAGLQAFPFAKDSLALATAKTSNAPAAISAADMVKIYQGTVTNWNQLGGSDGIIKPLIPQSGSGTRSFFTDQLKAANGGTAVTLAGTVTEVQEHDPAPVQSDPNAVAPFSVGRNAVIGAPLRIEGGFTAARALYNVVRGADVARADLVAVFGASGFVCSPEAKPLIEAAGFDQLAKTAAGGVCGVATQDPTSNLLTSDVVDTATTVAGASSAAGALSLTATVAAGEFKPSGVVRFYLDGSATPVGNPAPLTGGKATANLSGLAAGAHKVVAKFTPSITAYKASESVATDVTVLAAEEIPVEDTPAAVKIKAKAKKSYAVAKKVKIKLSLTESGSGAPTGKVVVKLGKKKVAKATVKNGKVVVKLKPNTLKKGKNKLTVSYSGDENFKAAKLKFKITGK